MHSRRIISRLVATAIVFALCLTAVTSVHGASSYYVSPTGDDVLGDGSATSPWGTLQHAIDQALSDDTIVLMAGSHTGGASITQSGLTITGEPGATLLPGSPALTVAADGTTLVGLDIDGSAAAGSESGVVIQNGISELLIKNCDIHSWPADGIHANGALQGFKLIDSLLHDNGSDGIEFGDTPTGLINIYGNAFIDNTSYGVHNSDADSPADIPAEYNAWGHVAGPASGDTVSANVDAAPWVFGKLWVDPSAQSVRELETVTVCVTMDVYHLYGADVSLTFPKELLQLVSEPVIGSFETPPDGCSFTTNGMVDANARGIIEFQGYRTLSSPEYDATDDPLLTLEFRAQEVTTSSQTADLVLVTDAKLGAQGGVNIVIDSLADGSIDILGTSSLSGTVDLQGRSHDSGAQVDPEPGDSYGQNPSAVVTGEWGHYAFTDLTDDVYTVRVEMPRYLDAHAQLAVQGESVTPSILLLLGGDADDSDEIDISDMTIIGNQFGNDGAAITDSRADINADITVDILDLVLAGGNYGLISSPWTP